MYPPRENYLVEFNTAVSTGELSMMAGYYSIKLLTTIIVTKLATLLTIKVSSTYT